MKKNVHIDLQNMIVNIGKCITNMKGFLRVFVEYSNRLNSPLADITIFGISLSSFLSTFFKTCLLGRGFHTLINNVSFSSPTNVGSHSKKKRNIFVDWNANFLLKRTISACNGFGPLQMASKPNIGRCANKDVELQRGCTPNDMPARKLNPEGGWTRGDVPARTLGPEGGWIRGSHIDWRRERVVARTLGPEGGVDCEIPYWLGGE